MCNLLVYPLSFVFFFCPTLYPLFLLLAACNFRRYLLRDFSELIILTLINPATRLSSFWFLVLLFYLAIILSSFLSLFVILCLHWLPSICFNMVIKAGNYIISRIMFLSDTARTIKLWKKAVKKGIKMKLSWFLYDEASLKFLIPMEDVYRNDW